MVQSFRDRRVAHEVLVRVALEVQVVQVVRLACAVPVKQSWKSTAAASVAASQTSRKLSKRCVHNAFFIVSNVWLKPFL